MSFTSPLAAKGGRHLRLHRRSIPLKKMLVLHCDPQIRTSQGIDILICNYCTTKSAFYQVLFQILYGKYLCLQNVK